MYLVWTHWPVTNVIIGLPMTPNYGMSFKKTKWRTAHSESVACLTPPSIGLIFCGEGTGHFKSSGSVSRFVSNTKLFCAVIGPITTPNDYLNVVFDDASWMMLLACAGAAETMPCHGLQRKSLTYSLLQFSPWVWWVFPYNKAICYLLIACQIGTYSRAGHG